MNKEQNEKKRQDEVRAIFNIMKGAVKEFNKVDWKDLNEVKLLTPIRNELTKFLAKAARKPKKVKKAKK